MTSDDPRPTADPVAQLRSVLAAAVAGNLRLASRLNALVWDSASTLATQAAASLGVAFPLTARPARPATEPETAQVRLEAQAGRAVAVAFGVENRYDRSVDVSFDADPLVGDAERPVPPEVISFDPPTMALGPGERRVARAVVHIGERFAVGATYTTALRVRRLPAPPLRVEIAVVPGRGE